jgi:putative membrane protein
MDIKHATLSIMTGMKISILNCKPTFILIKNICMKKRISLLLALPFVLFACNNESNDSVEKADSINETRRDTMNQAAIVPDEESSSFLVKAANGGMAEVEVGQMAQQKAVNQKVKDFGSIMVHDHTAANAEVKTLAAKRNIALPDSVSAEKKQTAVELGKKTGKEFDKSFMRTMEKDHQEAIDLFEKASGTVKDSEVKIFIDNTLPKLRMHLDSAKAVQKAIK